MSWYNGLFNGQPARVNERPDGKIDILFNFDGSNHDHMVTTVDGTNVEYWRENGIDRIDASKSTNAYPDTPHKG